MANMKVCKTCRHYEHVGTEVTSGDNFGACKHPTSDIPSDKPPVRVCKGWEPRIAEQFTKGMQTMNSFSEQKPEILGKDFDRIIIESDKGGDPVAVITRHDIEPATGFRARLLPSKD